MPSLIYGVSRADQFSLNRNFDYLCSLSVIFLSVYISGNIMLVIHFVFWCGMEIRSSSSFLLQGLLLWSKWRVEVAEYHLLMGSRGGGGCVLCFCEWPLLPPFFFIKLPLSQPIILHLIFFLSPAEKGTAYQWEGCCTMTYQEVKVFKYFNLFLL